MKNKADAQINLERLEARMDEAGLDAVVARAGLNLCYLTGFAYPGTLARHVDLTDSPRAIYLVWPRKGEPVLIVNAIAEGLARRDSWVEKFEVYEAYAEPPAERLTKVLAGLGLDRGTLGFERNYINASDWETLRGRLPHAKMVDSSPLMDDVRAVKTPVEIELFRQGADILDDAFLKHFPTVRAGMRERDLHAALVAECLANGCEFVHGILNSSRNTVAYAGESDFAFATGDAIRTDYVAYRKGYPGHQSRCAVIGSASAEQKRDYRIIRDLYRDALDQCRPGRTAGEVYQSIVESFGRAGLNYHHAIAGHSVGAWWHQQEPVISRGNPRTLEEGMVIAMEPHINEWHIQDMVVVRAGGPELISAKFPTDAIFECG